MTISESKKALRKEILAKRRNLSEAYQKQAAQEIYEKLRALAVYKEASVLCLYVPIQKEVDLFQYIPEFRADGKQIYLPRVNGNTMDFYAYNEQTALVEGAYHILEPDSMVQLEPEKTGGTCLIVMPGQSSREAVTGSAMAAGIMTGIWRHIRIVILQRSGMRFRS